MPSRSQKIRLGIFIVISSFALLVLLFIVGSKQFFQDKDIYYISYRDISVSGLEVGSPVKYLGINIGTIKSIDFDPEDVYNVVVTVAVKPGTPIKRDARANIEAIGITGLKMIEIRGGSNEAKLLQVGKYIQAGGSITEDITGKAEVIANKIERVVNNLIEFTQPEKLEKIIKLAESSTLAMDNINAMVEENRLNLRDGLESTKYVMARMDTISQSLQIASTKIQKLTESDTLDLILANVHDVSVNLTKANLGETIVRLDEVVERTNKLLISMDRDMERGSRDFLASLQKLKSALDHLNEASRLVNEDPSVLIRGAEVDEIPDDELD
ncbi:MAG: MCE family protein [Calditrichaeota bacterium]|nr:MAG: MCE family protein [Calditrichota bacterium]MBL1204656.1 MCE family protein [Calditrichota bacterium]NOG44484.1 MCE family protein [Calditrichota bacterium]